MKMMTMKMLLLMMMMKKLIEPVLIDLSNFASCLLTSSGSDWLM